MRIMINHKTTTRELVDELIDEEGIESIAEGIETSLPQ